MKTRFLILLLLSSQSIASDLGTIGLIDTPTARMRPDGEFSAAISKQSAVDIYSLNYQATPWLETTFRYSAFTSVGYYDRSYEVKVRLLQENDILPAVSVGIRDLLGTGVFSSEYLVANKAFGNLDVSLGLGWGRFAEREAFSNPIAQLSDRFSQRERDVGLGGTVQFDSFFAGPDVGVFGGASYKMPNQDLTFLVEYNSDNYETRERRQNLVNDPSPISYGFQWEPIDGVVLGGSHQFGEQFAFSIESKLDTLELPIRHPREPFISSLDLASAGQIPEGRTFGNWYERLLYDTERSGLRLYEASSNANRSEITLVIGNRDYGLAVDAINQFLTLAELHLPRSYRSLSIVLNEGGIQPVTINYFRPEESLSWASQGGAEVAILAGRELEDPDSTTAFNMRRLSFSANIGTRFQFFDPDDPLRYQLNLKLGASSRLGWGWDLRSEYIVDIDNTFNEIQRESDSVLPHVRSDSALYLKEGASGLESLYVDRKDNLSSNIFYRLYAGVLEEMYSGIGGEVLYQSFRSRLAYGFSANWVKQRDYDKSFSHLEYSTVTAFASLYWATPWYNYDVAVHAGQFLAKDLGAKFEVRRTMDNGWMLGAWATFTDVSSDDFGEGSFDKGIYLRIPLQGLLGTNSRAAYGTSIRSIQRDGGQMLENFSGKLWHDLRSTRYDALDNNRARMVPSND